MRKLVTLLLLIVVAAACTSPAPAPAPATQPAMPAPTATATPVPQPTPRIEVIATGYPGELQVDPSHGLGPISKYVYGTNYGPWVGLRPEILDEAKASGVTIIRWPGGEWGDQNDASHFQIDMFMNQAQMMSAEPYIHVRFLKSTPEKAAEFVRYTNKEKGYNIKYWSIGNEPNLYEAKPDAEENQWNAEAFSQEWRKFAEAMRAVDPSIVLIGPEVTGWTGAGQADPKDKAGRDWLRTFLKINGDAVDMVSIHRYPFPNNAEKTSASAPDLRADAPEWTPIVYRLRQAIREETGKDLPVAITEWNSHWSRAIGGEATPDSFYNAIWMGDVLGRLITAKVDMANQFLLVSPQGHSGFGLLESYSPRPSYYTWQMYKQFGDELVASNSGLRDVSVYAAKRKDGSLTIMMINLGDQEANAPVQIAGREGDGPAEVYLLEKTRLEEDQQLAKLDDINVGPQTKVSIPSRSMLLWVVKPVGAPSAGSARPKEVHAWAPYFTALEQITLEQNKDLIKELNFVWYQLEADGKISGALQSPQGVGVSRAYGIRVVPSIQNGGFDAKRVSALIGDAAKRTAHVETIVSLVVNNRYDGIDIDYESLNAADRENFSLFIEELAAALHVNSKLLSVTVHPKTSENPGWDGPKAQDWARLGKAADEFKIMVYDYSYSTSKAGEIAPIGWADEVLAYAATLVPPEKTYLGVPFYGYDWIGSAGQPLDWIKATKIAKEQSVEVKRSASNEATFTYNDGKNTVYFNDALTMKARLDMLLAKHPNLAGIAIWRLGNEDPGNWTEIRHVFVKQ